MHEPRKVDFSFVRDPFPHRTFTLIYSLTPSTDDSVKIFERALNSILHCEDGSAQTVTGTSTRRFTNVLSPTILFPYTSNAYFCPNNTSVCPLDRQMMQLFNEMTTSISEPPSVGAPTGCTSEISAVSPHTNVHAATTQPRAEANVQLSVPSTKQVPRWHGNPGAVPTFVIHLRARSPP